jgi:hypothetical protein
MECGCSLAEKRAAGRCPAVALLAQKRLNLILEFLD